MSYSAKTSLMLWWIAIVFAVLLWYRNSGLDRFYAIYALYVALISLVTYACYSGIDTKLGGILVYIITLFIIVVLAIAAYLKTSSFISLLYLIIIGIVFIIVGLNTVNRRDLHVLTTENKIPVWHIDGGNDMFEYTWILIVSGFVIPLLLLAHNYSTLKYDTNNTTKNNLLSQFSMCWELYVYSMFIIISAIIVRFCSSESPSYSWVMFLLILIFLIWSVGMTPMSQQNASNL